MKSYKFTALTSTYRRRMKDKIPYGCVDCRELRKCMLAIHHIDHDRKNNKIDNLEVVCHNHHILRHLSFSGGNETDTNSYTYNPRALTSDDQLRKLGANR